MAEVSTVRSADSLGGARGASGGTAGLLLLYADPLNALENVYFFRASPLCVGRGSANGVVLPHETVSRHHAELSWTERGWAIRDLGSANGTWVNGRRVRACLLPHSALVRLGDLFFKFVASELELHAAYGPDGRMRGVAQRLGPTDSRLLGGLQMDQLAAQLRRVAQSDLSLLLTGESGTGKEIAAQEVHRWSGRRGPFVAVNCAAIPAPLLESELFGHKKGAFSGAVADKLGLFQSARAGTLLLDEIGDMPIDSQAKLLRVLQSKVVTPLGGVDPERIDVRVISATHQDLKALQAGGRFRLDLFARINDVTVSLPPLRVRKEDVVPLTLAFLQAHGRPSLKLSVGFVNELLRYDWPYNVRELEACIRRAVTLATTNVLTRKELPSAVLQNSPDDVADETAPPPARDSAAPAAGTPSEEDLRTMLTIYRGNISAIAGHLGKARMQVHRWLQRYGIDPAAYRESAELGHADDDLS